VRVEEPHNLVGRKIWLEYYDQNDRFEEDFTPQYCTVERRFSEKSGPDDWFLVSLEVPLDYECARYSHLLIRSRWADVRLGGSPYTSVFILLVPDAEEVKSPFEFEDFLSVAWGLAAQKREDIER